MHNYFTNLTNRKYLVFYLSIDIVFCSIILLTVWFGCRRDLGQRRPYNRVNSLFRVNKYIVQGAPRNMTVGNSFECLLLNNYIRYQRLFAIYLTIKVFLIILDILDILLWNQFYHKMTFMWYFYYSLWYQITYK